MLGVTLPGNEFEIDFDGHGLAAELKLGQQVGDSRAVGRLTGLAVNSKLHIQVAAILGRVFHWRARLDWNWGQHPWLGGIV